MKIPFTFSIKLTNLTHSTIIELIFLSLEHKSSFVIIVTLA